MCKKVEETQSRTFPRLASTTPDKIMLLKFKDYDVYNTNNRVITFSIFLQKIKTA